MGSAKAREKFLIIDDHPLFREALHAALDLEFPGAFAIDAETLEEAEELIANNPPFDLALLDLNIPGVQGTDGLLYLRKLYPRLPIFVISGFDDNAVITQVMAAGAAGFISKSSTKSDLAHAVRQIVCGEVYLPETYIPQDNSPAHAEQIHLINKLESLTPQQFKVLQMIRGGLLNKQIAYELGVGETTVKAHVSEILRKLNVVSRTQVVIEVNKLDMDHPQLRDFMQARDGNEGARSVG